MKNHKLSLFLEINKSNFIFCVGKNEEFNNFKIIYKLEVPLQGIDDSRISDLEKSSITIKQNIYLIEQKFNYIFKEIILILDNFNPTFINFSGFKKLNGSQVFKENIIYILNTLKSCVNEQETNKTILHIFNSKFLLDNKKIDNPPLGLFGNFYSQELSFILIDKNDHKNLINLLSKSNLNIKKILLRSFIDGAYLSNMNDSIETFFKIKINTKDSKIFYFENNSLKLEINFKFGTEIILEDISKITSLKRDNIENILNKIELYKEIPKDDLLEKEFFKEESYKKIKKKLIYEIILARVQEIAEIMFFKNINLHYNLRSKKKVYLEISDKVCEKNFKEIYKDAFTKNGLLDVNFIDHVPFQNIMAKAYQIVHFGWKKEAIPFTQLKKSLIARVFKALFG